jgi:D-3-phosphoglycerate dehydrogenase / 2-oxoglutarate reductase
MALNFLIVDKMHPSLSAMLIDIGISPNYQPNITRASIIEQLSQYDGLVIRSKTFVDKELLTNASKLKFICRAGAGIDNLDVKYIESQNIKIVNAPEGNRNALAEHTIGLLFSLLNNIVKSDREIRQLVWDREGNRGHEIVNKTVGIIGYGYMGTAFASKLKHFGCRIIAYDKYKSDFATDGIEEVSLEEIFQASDIVSLHVPLTEETIGLVNGNFFKKFSKPIWVINTSRGEVVDLRALIENIEGELVLGAALDVLENEKLDNFTDIQKKDFEYLANSNKIILTPHVAGWSFESYVMINKVLVEKLKRELMLT